MPKRSPQVDAYIEESADFAKPIVKKLRSLFHKGCPQLEERIKWGHISFEYKGILGGVAVFKKYVSWGMWKAALMKDPTGALGRVTSSAMSGGNATSVAELPPDEVILEFIRQAVDLNERGVKLPQRSQKTKKPEAKVPPVLAAALKKNAKAKATFDGFPPSCRREYIEWITQAKQDATRDKRVAQTIEWLKEGKQRNWKYMAKKRPAATTTA